MGKKVVRERKILEVHIDKGMKDGQKITFSGEGDQVCCNAMPLTKGRFRVRRRCYNSSGGPAFTMF